MEPPETIASEVRVRVTVQPVGTDPMVSPTVPFKLFTEVTVIVELVEAPAATVKMEGEAEIEKLGAGGGTEELFFP